MSTQQKTPRELHGLLAAFDNDRAIVAAARTLHERGLRDLDAFLPRPIDELEELIAPQRSTLPGPVLIAAIIGAITGLGVQWFCNTWDMPLNVGGRPPFSLPAFIPITFEMTVLFGSVTAFVTALHRMGLPHLAHPVFETDGFERASIDQFWLYIGAHDEHYDPEPLSKLLRDQGAVEIRTTPSAATPPEPEPGSDPQGATA